MGWNEFLYDSQPADHGVQIYNSVRELAESVSVYLAAGLEAGEPVVVVARPKSWETFAGALARGGWDPAVAEERGMLTLADAGTSLADSMEGDRVSASRFRKVIGDLLDDAAGRHPGARIRVFGEMVDILCLRGQPDAALELEELWNDLARTRNFALLCGYRLDVFDPAAQTTALPGVCDSHSHVRPASDPTRLAQAVDRALHDVLGSSEAGEVYVSVGREVEDKRVPVSQLILMWVSANLPNLADRVLSSARTHYERTGAVSPS